MVLAWLANLRYAVGVAAVVRNDAGQVLLLRHTYRRAGFEWGLPGGWAKGRESMERALAREILEETGFTIAIEQLVAVHSGYALPRMTVIFLAHIESGEFRSSDEVSAYRFSAPDNLGHILLAEQMAVRQALELAVVRER
ncbi:MAG: hydrolase [Chloroflexi bacterium]|nr:hydrolase [Chloroflexota bacterium]